MTYRVMTVCTGNICRSPMAEVVLQQAFAQAGLDTIVTSTGISDEEAGNPMDRRALKALAAQNLPNKQDHYARRVTANDICDVDLVIPMTSGHARALRNLAQSSGAHPEIKMMREFDPTAPKITRTQDEYLLDVDDPWYGGPQDFANCLTELLAAAPGVVDYVRQQTAANSN